MKTIDEYLKRASGKDKITDAIMTLSESLGVAVSTIHRWRRMDSIGSAEHCIAIVSVINKSMPDGEKKLGIRDIAILCNFKGGYR